MHLKQIDMENFKSFGHKVSIPFETGFTAVTGPNGSGKSNISDAILFVLGPRSAKAIRAGKLSDLIFNGGGTGKSPAKYCWVELVFDNSDRLMPIDEDAVRLRRVIRMSTQRKGDYNSYFYINDRASSLNEFDALLAHARISAEGYNLVQQGDINRITAMSNLERRRILDDIAGITRFDEDIDSANKKRAQAEENIKSIQLVLEEVKRGIALLAKDKEAAAKFKDTQDRLAMARAQLAHLDVEEARERVNEAKKKEVLYKVELEKFEKELKGLEEELEGVIKDFDAAESEIAELGGGASKERRDKIENLRIEIAKADQRAEKAKAVIDETRLLRKTLSNELKKMEKELQLLDKQKRDAAEERARLTKDYDKARKDLDTWRSSASQTGKDVADFQRLAALKVKELTDAQKKRHEVELEIDRLEERIGHGQLLLKELEEKVKSQELQAADAAFQIKEIKNETAGAKGTIDRLQKRLAELKKEDKALGEDAAQAEKEVLELTRQLAEARGAAEAAMGVERGYMRSVADILHARDKGELKGIHGTVAELVKVDAKYERALEVAAGGRMQAIVVDEDGSAAAAIDHLKRTKSGRATFLPLNKLRGGHPAGKALMVAKEPDVIGFAVDLVKFNEKYEAALWYAFGDTLVVKTMDAARRLMGGVRLVTLEGDLIEPAGAMIGGAPAPSTVKFGSSSAPADEVRRALQEATDRSNAIANRLKATRTETVKLEDELRNASGDTGGARSKLPGLEATRTEAEKILANLKAQRETKAKALAADEKRKAELAKQLSLMGAAIEKLDTEREELTKRAVKAAPKEVALKIQTSEKSAGDLLESLTQAKGRFETLETQIGVLSGNFEKAKEELKRLDGKAAAANKEVEEAAEQSEAMRQEVETLVVVDKKSASKFEAAQARKDKLYQKKTDLGRDVDDLKNKIDATQGAIQAVADEIRNQDTALLQAEENLKNFDVKVKLPLPPRDEAQAMIRSCEKRMSEMGAVNLRALTDFDSEVARRDSMEKELKDLDAQRESLLQMVEELNKKKKFGLFKVFDAINVNFKEIYQELSAGGSAELILENVERPFEGGLMVRAQPRGKKVLRIESLSGGEKSLTALSLIFAIQQFQPSPFYLLDEVDMFLDAVNAESVARMVRKNSATAQFVMISLRKVTLSHADHIYGVTMMGKGVSEVIGNVSVGTLREDAKAGIVLKAAAH